MDQKGYPEGYPPQGPQGYPPQNPQYHQGGAAPPPYPGQAPYPQGQPGYGQQYPQHQGPAPTTTVIVAGPMRFGESPVSMKCQYCHADIVTGTTHESGLATWLVAGACCIFGFWFGCCLIPFCIDGLKDVSHSCPNCQRRVGKYSRIS